MNLMNQMYPLLLKSAFDRSESNAIEHLRKGQWGAWAKSVIFKSPSQNVVLMYSNL